MNSGGFAISVKGLTRRYAAPGGGLTVLDNVNFDIAAGERIALTGESGSGKTTLLYLLGGLDVATAGTVSYGGTSITQMAPDALAEFRNRNLGFVWQQASLLVEFTALENVAMPLRVRGIDEATAHHAAVARLEEVGLGGRAAHRTGELSGGEQQRVALARALVTSPRVLLADEPTGSLDIQTADRIISLVEEIQVTRGLTVILATHNPAFALRCHRVFRLGNAAVSDATMKGRSYV